MLNPFRTSGDPRHGTPLRRAAVVAVVAVLAAAVAAVWFPVLPAPRQRPVNISWVDGLTETEKAESVRRLGLEPLEIRDDGVWITRVTDSSTAAIRAIVEDPRVADTFPVDRRDFTLAREWVTLDGWLRYPGSPLRDFYRGYVSELLRPAVVPLVALLVPVWVSLRPAFRGHPTWLTRGIPDLSAHGLAAFRIVYGGALMAIVSVNLGDLPRDAHRLVDWAARSDFIRDISAGPAGAVSVQTALLWSLGLFTVGLVPRLTLAVSAALLTLLTAVMVTHQSVHDWGLPMIAMWLLVAVPWHEGFGLSWMWRRWRGRPEPVATSPRGLAVWLPPLALGAAFAAAAFAKLDVSGLEWITGGAVRYHFVQDSAGAPVTWGLSIAASDRAAVLLSLGAVVAEVVFLGVIFFRRALVRLLFGLVAAAILAGFYLFQGIWWPAWWVLLLALLPWSPVIDGLVACLPRLTVLADGECPLCRRTARALHGLDWFDRLTFADASDDAVRARVAPGLDRHAALSEMHVIDEAGVRAVGYDGYLRISAAAPLLWIPGLLGRLPPAAAAGRGVYRRVAASRIRRGRCTDELCAPDDAPLPVRRAEQPRAMTRAAVLVIGVFLFQQIVVSALRLESEPLISNFPMYSSTWSSQEAFDRHLVEKTQRYEISTDTLSAEQLAERLGDLPNADAVLDKALAWAVQRKAWQRELRDQADTMLRDYQARYGESLGPVRVVLHDQAFDWRRGVFEARATPAGTLDIASGTLRAPDIARSDEACQ